MLMFMTLPESYSVIMCSHTVATGVQQILKNHQRPQVQEVTGNRHSLSHDVTIKPFNLFGVTDCDETCLIYLNMMRKRLHLKQ